MYNSGTGIIPMSIETEKMDKTAPEHYFESIEKSINVYIFNKFTFFSLKLFQKVQNCIKLNNFRPKKVCY